MKHLLSTRVTLVLLLILAGSMGAATFIENDHGTATARTLVYEAWWFEVVMIWLCVNFIAHIKQYRLFSKGKLPLGLFHAAFIVIILGAGVTRLFSKEGIIHIRVGSAENTYYSVGNYLQLASQEGEIKLEKAEFVSKTFTPQSSTVSLDGHDFQVNYEQYIPSARIGYAPGEETILEVSLLTNGERNDMIVRPGQLIDVGELLVGIDHPEEQDIKIWHTDTAWMISTKVHLQLMEMSTQQMGIVHEGSTEKLKLRTLYQWENGAMVIKSIQDNVKLIYTPELDENVAENYVDALKVSIADPEGNLLSEGYFPKVSFKPEWKTFSYQGKTYQLTYGPKKEQLPFSLYLNAFELDRYPGSQSPSSYASEVMVQDEGKEWPVRIYMNNVLDHKGYRFYQSSYDSDEAGTVLSINQDRPGTYLTYFGYTLLTIGMFLTLFAPGSRFSILQKKLAKLSKTAGIFLLLLLANESLASDSIARYLVPEEKAMEYGRLIVQDLDGRMKPLNTLANEIMRKLSGGSTIKIPMGEASVTMTPEQFLLAVQLDPAGFSELPLIKIDQKKSQEVFQALGKEPTDRLRFVDFVNEEGTYLLGDLVEKATLLKPSERNEGHKELLKTDERFNIFYGILIGDFLKLYPNKIDDNNTWYT
ncbi:MAG: cytochrome c biogenesis protein ResB, partial [Algoriphagus sp.]